MTRRPPTITERLTACECCNYPISQRHHLLDVAHYGEHEYTKQLCANCHELFHLIYKAITIYSMPTNKLTNKIVARRSIKIVDDMLHNKEYAIRMSYLFECANYIKQLEKNI